MDKFSCFLSFADLNFKNYLKTIRLSNSLDLDQARHFVEQGPEVIKLFSYSTQLSTKFQLLIKTKIPTNEAVSCFKSLRCCIYRNIYEQDKFCAQLS